MSSHLIGGREFAALIGLAYPGQFNAARIRLQRVLDRGRVRDYPHHLFETGELDPSQAATRRQARKDYDAATVLVVPEWGGIRYPGTVWLYDRRVGEAIRDRGLNGLDRELENR